MLSSRQINRFAGSQLQISLSSDENAAAGLGLGLVDVECNIHQSGECVVPAARTRAA